MYNDGVNQRVVSAINFLLSEGIVAKKGDIAEKLGYSRQSITEILGGRQGVKVDFLQKFFDEFNISYEYIFKGTGSVLNNVPINVHQPVHLSDQKTLISGKTESINIVELPVAATDETDMLKIPIVEIDTAAGNGAYNPDYLSEVEVISMPRHLLKNGKLYLCVRNKGLSMFPTLHDGSYLVVSFVDRSEWADIKENRVYVVSDREGKTFTKRLKNRLKEHGIIIFHSDNLDTMRYPSFNLTEDEINTVWYVEWHLSPKMPNLNDTYYNRLTSLEDSIEELKFDMAQMRALQQKN